MSHSGQLKNNEKVKVNTTTPHKFVLKNMLSNIFQYSLTISF